MEDKINLKKQVDTNIFELPKPKTKSWWLSLKFNMASFKITPETAEIIISNKTSPYDKNFLSANIGVPHVFLRDEIVKKLYSPKLSKDEKLFFSQKIKELLDLNICVVIFPERHTTIFGDFGVIPENITSFFKQFERKITFFSLVGTYFIKPIWSQEENVCQTKIEQRFQINPNMSKNLTAEEFNKRFNEFMPSSASTYIYRYSLFLRGKKLAENLDSIIYLCPNCNKLLSLYSEYGCVKCADCGTAFELDQTGEIALTKKFANLDEARMYQKSMLSKFNFKDKLVVKYNDVVWFDDNKCNLKASKTVNFSIYANKIVIETSGNETKIPFDKIFDIYLEPENILKIETKQGDEFIFKGKPKENFYIIFDLIDLFKTR